MVFNGGKGGQPSPGPSACGSRLCRLFGFVLLVAIGVLLYSCMTLMSRNEALSDRVLMYARELTRSRTKEQGLEKRTAEMRQQNYHCHDQLSERSREFATLKLDTDRFKKQAIEYQQKLETMATEFKAKEDACAETSVSCKKQIAEHEDEIKRLKESQETANVECEKKTNVELARVIRVLRTKYGVEPVTELAKAGVDVARILQFMGGSQLPDSNQVQRSGQDQQQPNSGQEQPKSGQEQPKSGQEQRVPDNQEQPKSGQELPKSGQQQPNSGQEQPKPGQEQPKPGQEQRVPDHQEQPKSDQQQPNSGQEQPKPGQEQPKSGQEQEKLQFKRPEDIKRDEDQKEQSEREKPNEDGREKQKSSQEQPKTDQTEEQENKSERETGKSAAQGSDHSNRDEFQKSRSTQEKSKEDEEEKPKQDDAKDGQESSRDDGERTTSDQEQPKENQAKEEEKDKSEKKDAKPGQEDVKSSQSADRQEADKE